MSTFLVDFISVTFELAANMVKRVLVTGAAGQIGYSLVYMVAHGDVFGPDEPIDLVLLDIPPMLQVLEGVVMELSDCSFPVLRNVIASVSGEEAFKGIDAAFLVGAMPRREGMERKDLLAANVKIFKAQGGYLDQYAKKTVKVVVVGNPANTNCFICQKYAPSIPRENFSAMTRLDHNRAIAQIAGKAAVLNTSVRNVIIWGNHSSTQYPDATHGTVLIQSGNEVSVHDAIGDDHWLKNDFIKTVQQRGSAIINARKLSSAMSAAKAVCDHMRDWFKGTKPGEWVSMAVTSDGSYDIPEGLIYSFPVVIQDGRWKIVPDLTINDFSRDKMDISAKELIDERNVALQVCDV